MGWGQDSTWMGDRLGTPGVVDFLIGFFERWGINLQLLVAFLKILDPFKGNKKAFLLY